MNQVEERFARHLETRRLAQEIDRWEFENHKLHIGHICWYMPDFWVIEPSIDPRVVFYEVKTTWLGPWRMVNGKPVRYKDVVGWREDAKIKIKAAARIYPEYVFMVAVWAKDHWEFQQVKPR